MSAQPKDTLSERFALMDECHDLKIELAYVTQALATIYHYATTPSILGDAGHLKLIAERALNAPRLAKLGRSDAPDHGEYDAETNTMREIV